jgi:metal-responsive CopG/Arc/MetJ family transcriptional regulator
MAKVTISIPETALDAVDQAAAEAGMSRSEFIATAAQRAAMRAAYERYQQAKRDNPAFAEEAKQAHSFALRRGRAVRAAAVHSHGEAA